MTPPTKQIVKQEAPEPFALSQITVPEITALIRDNIGAGVSIAALERVKVPASGSTVWTREEESDAPAPREIAGIIIYFKDRRAYWPKKYEGGAGDPPQCASDNGITGTGNPGGDCAGCKFAAWGSAPDSRGQACKATRLLYILQPTSLLPIVLSVPPTSIQPVRKYLLRLVSERLAYHSVVTRLRCKAEQSKTGQKYAEIVATRGDVLDAELATRVAAYRDAFIPLLQAAAPEQLEELQEEGQ